MSSAFPWKHLGNVPVKEPFNPASKHEFESFWNKRLGESCSQFPRLHWDEKRAIQVSSPGPSRVLGFPF